MGHNKDVMEGLERMRVFDCLSPDQKSEFNHMPQQAQMNFLDSHKGCSKGQIRADFNAWNNPQIGGGQNPCHGGGHSPYNNTNSTTTTTFSYTTKGGGGNPYGNSFSGGGGGGWGGGGFSTWK